MLFSCGKATDELTPVSKSLFSGYVQKGPYINGSSISITPLDRNLNQTGSVFSTQIIDNSGNFEQRNIEFASNFVELKADGYYFNEVKGELSNGSLTLYALADIKDVNSVNINVLTHLERQRIIYLVQNSGLSFSAAKNQARTEVLDIFKFALPAGVFGSESLDITEEALLLAVSVIVQGHLSTGDMSELLANISSDIRTDGKLSDVVLWEQLMNNIAFVDLEEVKSNMENRYNSLGMAVNIDGGELKSYIEHFKNNSGVESTVRITYPATGKGGPNILADAVLTVNPTLGNLAQYSVRAVLPEGSSLKIVISGVMGDFGFYQGSDDNWIVSNTADGQFTLIAIESGKYADASFSSFRGVYIEYYENGATAPTKVKVVNVVN